MKPLLHFLVLGALLFGASRLPQEPVPARETVRIAAADVARLRAQWPDERRFQLALERHVREEVLLSEALRLGFDRDDPVARERMLANLRFAFPADRRGDEALLREARALAMARRDVVVRRRLVQRMEQRLAAAAPTGRELARYVADEARRLAADERYTFQQVFFRSDAAARAALVTLREGAAVEGEPFLMGDRFAGLSSKRVERSFGADFAVALRAAPQGEWTGPVVSPFGLHLVRVASREAIAPDLAALQAPLAYALQHEQRRHSAREAVAALRASYRVELP